MKKLSKKIKRFRVKLRRERRRQRKLEYDYRFLHNTMVTYERKLKKKHKIEDVQAVYRKTLEMPRYAFFTWISFMVLTLVFVFHKGVAYDSMKVDIEHLKSKVENFDIDHKKEIVVDKVKRDMYTLRREVEAEMKRLDKKLIDHEMPADEKLRRERERIKANRAKVRQGR